MSVEIGFADSRDHEYLKRNDDHLSDAVLQDKIARREVIVIRVDGQAVGWLRFGFFWDVVPFMNMLAVDEEERRKGYGTPIITFWENQMRVRGYELAMTSTQADELAQHLYRRLGYRDCGSITFPGQIPLEVFLLKSLN